MKPRIAIVADVRGWAWERKAKQLQHHLSDEFDIQIVYQYTRPADPIPTDVDLVHTFEVMQAIHGAPSAPFVTGITAHVWDGHERNHGRELLDRTIRKARAFHANSVLLVEDTARRFGFAPVYCPNGVDETFWRPTQPKPTGHLVVGWVGKPNHRKGGDIVKNACAHAGVEIRTVENTYRDALPAEAMRDFYQGCHVVLVASDFDGTPNHALEGAACGCAVVGNRVGNVPELVEHGVSGLLVGPLPDPAPRQPTHVDLADALRELAADVPRAIRMGEAARGEIERAWTWRDLSRNYAAMWRWALDGSAA